MLWITRLTIIGNNSNGVLVNPCSIIRIEPIVHKEVKHMRKYEGVLIFLPSLEEEKRVQLLNRFKGIIEADGSISNVDEWGIRKLAYLIDDIGEGYYVLLNFEGTPEVVKELDRVARISDGIMRHMIIREEE